MQTGVGVAGRVPVVEFQAGTDCVAASRPNQAMLGGQRVAEFGPRRLPVLPLSLGICRARGFRLVFSPAFKIRRFDAGMRASSNDVLWAFFAHSGPLQVSLTGIA